MWPTWESSAKQFGQNDRLLRWSGWPPIGWHHSWEKIPCINTWCPGCQKVLCSIEYNLLIASQNFIIFDSDMQRKGSYRIMCTSRTLKTILPKIRTSFALMMHHLDIPDYSIVKFTNQTLRVNDTSEITTAGTWAINHWNWRYQFC